MMPRVRAYITALPPGARLTSGSIARVLDTTPQHASICLTRLARAGELIDIEETPPRPGAVLYRRKV